jgi:hypothetical protein
LEARKQSLEDAMFEEELALEKKSSNVVPLLLIVTLIVAIAGVSLYFVIESQKKLTSAEARPIIQASIERQLPATLKFETGLVEDQTSPDARYRLLEKEGYLKIGKNQKDKTPVSLTDAGQAWLAGIPGVKEKDKEGTKEYTVPLATRKLVDIGKVTMETSSRATVEYTWKWEPTKAGDLLDAAGPAVQAFGTWDRTTLIDKFGAAFYHGDPTRVTVLLTKQDNGWEIGTE